MAPDRPIANLGHEPHRLLQQLDARHLGHALIGHDKRDRIAALLELAECVDGRGTGFGTHDTVAIGIAPTQVAIDGAKDFRIVVDGEENGAHVGRLRVAASRLLQGARC
jgi:hypothetical protein